MISGDNIRMITREDADSAIDYLHDDVGPEGAEEYGDHDGEHLVGDADGEAVEGAGEGVLGEETRAEAATDARGALQRGDVERVREEHLALHEPLAAERAHRGHDPDHERGPRVHVSCRGSDPCEARKPSVEELQQVV